MKNYKLNRQKPKGLEKEQLERIVASVYCLISIACLSRHTKDNLFEMKYWAKYFLTAIDMMDISFHPDRELPIWRSTEYSLMSLIDLPDYIEVCDIEDTKRERTVQCQSTEPSQWTSKIIKSLQGDCAIANMTCRKIGAGQSFFRYQVRMTYIKPCCDTSF